MSITIRRATPADATELTAVAYGAKRHWNYPEAWILAWRDQLTVTPRYIEEQRVFVAEIEGSIGGFYALRGNGPVVELDHLWVAPERIGQGLGRRLVDHACRTSGAKRIEIDADPHAEAFYAHLGARRIGKTPAPVDGEPQRYLPRMVLEPADR